MGAGCQTIVKTKYYSASAMILMACSTIRLQKLMLGDCKMY